MAMSTPLSLRDQVKLSVSSVLAAFPVGIPLHNFLKEYKDLEGKQLPFRELGYNSPINLLISFKDVVRVIETSAGQKVLQGIPNEKSAHIYNFVQHQSTKMNKSARRVKELLRNGKPSQGAQTKAAPEVPRLNLKDVEHKIYNLLQCQPSGLPFSQLGDIFHERYGQNFHVSLEEFILMASKMETLNVRKVTNRSGTMYKIFRTGTMKTEPVSAREHGIPDDIKLKIQKVVDTHRGGVGIHEFYAAYGDINREPLNVQPMGFPCLAEFLETLDQEVIHLDRSRTDSIRILPLHHQTESQANNSSVSPLSCSRGATAQEDFNVDRVSLSHKERSQSSRTVSPLLRHLSPGSSGNLGREELPRAALEGKLFPIKIGWVLHPGNFWWSLEGSTKAVMSLEYEMTNFYESPANQNLVLLTNEIEAGQLVAAKSPLTFHWQRAMVVSYAMEGQYTVRFIDHGDLQKVTLSQLRPLSSKFTVLPIQAKKSRLHGIHIPDCGWPNQFLQQFKYLLYNGPLEARCVAVEDGQEPCYVVELTRNDKIVAKEIVGEVCVDTEEIVNEELTNAIKQIEISAKERLQLIRLANEEPFLVSEELAALTHHKTLESLKTRLKDQYTGQAFVCHRSDFPRVFDELSPFLDSASALEEIELLPLKFALQVLAFHGCSNPRIISLLKEEME